MTVEVDTYGREVEGGWQDEAGFISVARPGDGPRTVPKGQFPTGPEVDSAMPDVRCLDSFGKPFDLHRDRAGQTAVFLFQRSAVW